jgi:cyclic pyranopterin phosphate synthase
MGGKLAPPAAQGHRKLIPCRSDAARLVIQLVSPLPEDQLHRPLRDLRISVTDRCNFRCGYCMPREVFGAGHEFMARAELLSFEEITRLAGIFLSLGVEKVRLTGGEPLLRRELPTLVGMLAPLDGLRDLTLTTNGSRLAELASPLRAAGLRRLTVSVDSLDDATFRAMNDVDFPLHRVLRGIEAARAAGFTPIKINAVIKRGVNEDEIPAMARHFGGPDFVLRFIEYMDVGNTNGWRRAEVVPAAKIAARLGLAPLPPQYAGEVARRYRTPAGGEIGLIASVSAPFCGACTRARLSADGKLFTCLFATRGHDLRTPLRSGASDETLRSIISGIWRKREDRYSELRSAVSPRAEVKVEMSAIGG